MIYTFRTGNCSIIYALVPGGWLARAGHDNIVNSIQLLWSRLSEVRCVSDAGPHGLRVGKVIVTEP